MKGQNGSTPTPYRTESLGAPQVNPQVIRQASAVLRAARSPSRSAELQDAAGLKNRDHVREGHLEPLLAAGLLEMTIPDKPRSSLQRYRTTAAGVRLLEETPE